MGFNPKRQDVGGQPVLMPKVVTASRDAASEIVRSFWALERPVKCTGGHPGSWRQSRTVHKSYQEVEDLGRKVLGG